MRGQRLGRRYLLPRRLGRRPTQLFNVFARNDPVAYRLEPLLAEEDDEDDEAAGAAAASAERSPKRADPKPPPELPPPVYVPYAGDRYGTRLHIKLRQATNAYIHDVYDAKSRLYHNVYEVASSITDWFGGSSASAAASGSSASGSGASGSGSAASAAGEGSAGGGRGGQHGGGQHGGGDAPVEWALNGGGRVDYQLQESELEAAHEYLAALKGHNGYWGNPDVAAFIVHEVVGLRGGSFNP